MATAFETQLAKDLPRGYSARQDQVADARWATAADLDASWNYDRSGFFLGYLAGRFIGRNDDRHIVTVAGSRAGKGVSLVVPNLLLYQGSVLALDPKGELAKETKARRQRMGQRCIVLDPFNANKVYSTDSYNPLSEIDPDPESETAVDDAALIADAMITHDGGGDSHWTESAKLVLRALILFTLLLPEEERNLITVRQLLMLSHPLLEPGADEAQADSAREKMLFNHLAGCAGAFHDVLAATGETLRNMNANERSSVLSTARTQTAFLDSRPLQKVLTGKDFKLADLKRKKVTVYLCLPASRMATHAKWFRIIINLAMTIFETVEEKPEPPVLMVLDEFPVLGHMARIETAAGQIAGFGVKMWTILQDLTQLQRHYRESWETFIGNAGLLTFFGNSDVTTLKYVSEKLGSRGFKLVTPSTAGVSALHGGSSPITEQLRVDPLLAPHEVERLLARDTERLLVLAGPHPVIVQRARYYDDAAFKNL